MTPILFTYICATKKNGREYADNHEIILQTNDI